MFMEKFQEYGNRMAAQRHMSAIKDGLILSLPVTLAGSLFLIIRFLPIPGWHIFLARVLGSDYAILLSYPVAATFDIIGLLVCFTVAYRLSQGYKIDSLMAAITAICGYFTLTPSFRIFNIKGFDAVIQISGFWAFEYTGAQSLFVILLSTILFVEIYRYFSANYLHQLI